MKTKKNENKNKLKQNKNRLPQVIKTTMSDANFIGCCQKHKS